MYQFDDKNHMHTLDGKPLHGVTTVLSVISKPALIQWAAGMASQYIEDEVAKIAKENDGLGYLKELGDRWATILKEARVAHRKKKEAGGDWGKNVHEAIEKWIKTKEEPDLESTQLIAFENFKRWSEENKVEFLESEKHLHSKELWIGGICDLVIKMDGKKYVADIKTSSAIYNEHFFQMAAYALMLEEQGHNDIEGYLVINLKKDGKMDLKMALDMELNKQAFKHALGLYKIINSLQ